MPRWPASCATLSLGIAASEGSGARTAAVDAEMVAAAITVATVTHAAMAMAVMRSRADRCLIDARLSGVTARTVTDARPWVIAASGLVVPLAGRSPPNCMRSRLLPAGCGR